MLFQTKPLLPLIVKKFYIILVLLYPLLTFFTLLVAPKFLTKPEDSIAVQDKSIKFESTIESFPKPKVSWFLNDKELTVKDNVKIEVDAKTNACNLVIPKVSSTHLGKIKIVATNSVGSIEHTFDLNVLGNRIIICRFFLFIRKFIQYFYLESPKAGKLENVTAIEGTDANFNLKITGGKPRPQIKWFIEEEEIITSSNEQYEITEQEDTFILIIKSVKMENSGNYYAQLINETGLVSSNKAQLIVNSTLLLDKYI